MQTAGSGPGATNGYGSFANWDCSGHILVIWEDLGGFHQTKRFSVLGSLFRLPTNPIHHLVDDAEFPNAIETLHLFAQATCKTFDGNQRGVTQPDDLREPLDVSLHGGNYYSMSNRRLLVLLMYQAIRRDRAIEAPCVLRDQKWNGGKFKKADTTRNNGLGIDADGAQG